MGIDPMTHKPKSHALGPDQLKDAANLSHMAQWEGARLEAEARLVRESKLQVLKPFQTQPSSSASAHEATTTAPLPDLPLQPLCLDVLTAWQGSWLEAPGYNEFSAGNFATIGSLDSLTTLSNISKKGEAMGLANNFPDEIEILQLQGLAYSTDGLGDVLLDDSNQLYTSITNGNFGSIAGSCCDNFEANKNYWYNILNLVNCSPSDYLVF
ncbi:hypothetical protein Vadar_030069 [Vaccinium darrowii]|uniref:Uncharacterized protein n=1 Tax=Vaccinium darrowii TaxID=229202 RepID=A0ACB7X5K4_9ERIC|nr:hypothetical protein Vadar_030069 [Vaccinium darrowii]